LEGVLSLNDIVLHATPDAVSGDSIDYGDVVKTYQAICQHPVAAARSSVSA
jgi:hypothetical protein